MTTQRPPPRRSLATLGALLCLAAARASAQSASVATDYFPAATHGSNDEDILVLKAEASHPFLVGHRLIVTPGLSYDLVSFRESVDLHAVMALGSATYVFSEHWLGTLSSSAGFASDFRYTPGLDELLVNVAVIGAYRFGERLTLGLGLGYNRQLGRLAPIPMVSLALRSGDFRVDATVPALTQVRYRAARWLIVGLRQTLEGNRFHLDPDLVMASDVEAAYSLLTAGGQVTVPILPWLNVDAYGGIAALRKYEVFVDGTSVGDATIDPGPMFGVRIWTGDAWPEPPAPPPSPTVSSPRAPSR